MKELWKTFEKPIFALAPLHDVTDAAFRETIAACGKPTVMFTEFTSVDGLDHPHSQERMIKRYLQIGEEERPVIAQIWGTDPDKFYRASKLIASLGFDGIDINMGCPDKAVLKAGAGGGLIQTPELAREIIRATIEGAGELPVSVKTRLGYHKDTAEEWVGELIQEDIAALTMHARTIRELSKVPAQWHRIKALAPLCKEKGIPFIGNGDVRSLEEGKKKIEESGCDGVMIGRGIFGNFWFFNPEVEVQDLSLGEKLQALTLLITRFEKRYAGMRSIGTLKKHVRGLVNGFEGAADLRAEIAACRTGDEVRKITARDT